MSDDNGGSLLDSIIAGAMVFYFIMILIVLFPLMPGGVIGYEFSKTLTPNSDIHKLSIIIGMVVNFFVYVVALRIFDMDFDRISTKVYIYIFTIVLLLSMDKKVDNHALHQVNKMIVDTIKFFLDFDRWFVDSTIINMGLIALYAFVSFWIIAYVVKFITDIFNPGPTFKN